MTKHWKSAINDSMEKKVKKLDTEEKRSIMIRVDDELYRGLKEESKRFHLPVATVVKLWIVEKLEQRGAKKSA